MTLFSKKSNSRRAVQRTGVMLPLVALLLPVLIIFLGFSVDLAYMQNTRLELRAVTDASARAAASKLSKTGDENAAYAEGIRVAAANKVAGQPLELERDDIEIGRSTLNQNTNKWTFVAGGTPANAVRVVGARTQGSSSGSVKLFFGSQIGATDFQPETGAIASFVNVDICLVLDRSTSMKVAVNSDEKGLYTSDPRFCRAPNSSSRWHALHGAVQVFTDELRITNAREQVGLATYSSAIDPNLYCGGSNSPATKNLGLVTDLSVVDSEVDNISSSVWNGNTNIEAGMRVGIDVLQNDANRRTTADRVLIVLTDGNENEGSAEDAARDAAAANITIHTVTFSIDANQALMRSVASIGKGRHLHANSSSELREVFRSLAGQSAQLTQ